MLLPGNFTAMLIVVGTLMAGCGRGGSEITVTQPLSERERTVKVGATSEERFGGREIPGMESPSSAKVENPLRWETPEGWTELDSTQMRVVNLRFGPDGEGECYLSILPGAGGGMGGNINRWAGQMGVEPLSPEALAALPKKEIFGREAPFVDFEGIYKGMGNIEPIAEARMLGTVLADEQLTFFVKLVGPAPLVEAEEKNFERFCASLRIVTQ
jgi:hypothetical protein